MSTTAVTIRVETGLKKQAEELFEDLGTNMSGAMNMFLRKSVRTQSIPFRVTKDNTEIPNERLMKALEESEKIARGEIKRKPYNSFEEILDDLDNYDDDGNYIGEGDYE